MAGQGQARRVVLADLPVAEKERFYEFLVANKVEFVADASGECFVATIRVVPPEPSTARITGRSRVSAHSGYLRRSRSAGPKARPEIQPAAVAHHDPAATLKAAQSVLRRRYQGFCNLLPTLVQPPKALRKAQVVRFADEVYDARFDKDTANIRAEAAGGDGGRVPQTFPDFVYEFAAKRYGLKQLVSNNCWGMVSSVELLRGQSVAIDLFGRFLEESYDATDLLFFLFTRSALEKVLIQAAKQEEKDETKQERRMTVGTKRQQAKMMREERESPTTYKAEMRLDAKQCIHVIRGAIDAKAGNGDLREQVLKKLDAAMTARTEGGGRSTVPTLEPERLLAIATEEYHNSRGLAKDTAPLGDTLEASLSFSGEGPVSGNLPKEKDLDPEIRKEVRQVSQRLLASLEKEAQKEGGKHVNPEHVYEWALAVTLRKHKLGDFLDEPNAGGTSLDLQEMQRAAERLGHAPMSSKGPPIQDVLTLSPEEFERNLEGNVRQLLLNSTSDLVGEAVAEIPGKNWSGKAGTNLKASLVSEFAPIADTLMESIVTGDYDRWMKILSIQNGGTSRHKREFEHLRDQLQDVLKGNITASAVQQICRAVISPDELYEMVKRRADELANGRGDDDD